MLAAWCVEGRATGLQDARWLQALVFLSVQKLCASGIIVGSGRRRCLYFVRGGGSVGVTVSGLASLQVRIPTELQRFRFGAADP